MQKTVILACTIAAIATSGQGYAQVLAQEVQTQEVHRIELNTSNGPNTFVFVGGQMFNGKPVKGQPYSADAVSETTQTLADGNRIVNRSSSTIYRDSEGRERREESIGKLGGWNAQGEPAKVVFISDPVAKLSYTLHPDDRTAEKMSAEASMKIASAGMVNQAFTVTKAGADLGPGPVGFARRGIAESASSAKTEQLAPQMIEGVMAQGTRTTAVIPAGQIGNERDVTIVNERWFSTELGVVVMSKQSDPRMGETVYKLTSINRSEPQHSLFEMPADYTVSDGAVMKKLRDEKAARKEEQ